MPPTHSDDDLTADEIVLIADNDGDFDMENDPCGRESCGCARYLHEDGSGECASCSSCRKFLR